MAKPPPRPSKWSCAYGCTTNNSLNRSSKRQDACATRHSMHYCTRPVHIAFPHSKQGTSTVIGSQRPYLLHVGWCDGGPRASSPLHSQILWMNPPVHRAQQCSLHNGRGDFVCDRSVWFPLLYTEPKHQRKLWECLQWSRNGSTAASWHSSSWRLTSWNSERLGKPCVKAS